MIFVFTADKKLLGMQVKRGGQANLKLYNKMKRLKKVVRYLPIEADMRYTWRLHAIKNKRLKADDVPARLSKNEFVFTADAVR